MKLSDLIQSATAHELPRDDLAERITAGNFEKRKRVSLKRVLVCGMAAVMLLTASVSAYVGMRGGFDIVFGEDADRLASAPDVTVVANGNEDVVFEFTQAYCDEYNLHLGGKLTTPEPLGWASEHEYKAICDITINGQGPILTEIIIFPEGTESLFYINPICYVDRIQGMMKITEEDRLDVEVSIRYIFDAPNISSFSPVDYVLYDGEWIYSMQIGVTTDDQLVYSETYSADAYGLRVDNMLLTPFSVTLEGEGFTEIGSRVAYDPNYVPSDEVLAAFEKSGKTPNIGAYEYYIKDRTIMFVLEDGSVIGGSSNLANANTDIRIINRDIEDTKALIVFNKPVDPSSIVKILITGDHYKLFDDPTVHYDTYLEIPLK